MHPSQPPEPPACPVVTRHRDAAAVPAAPGAYALAIRLDAPLALALPGKPATVLAPGRYVYCGSARGPGGLRARVGRHVRRAKTVRWHVDRLTTAGTVEGIWCVPGGDECALVAALAGLPVPVPGFGSSDCRHCASHLLSWPDGTAPGFLGGANPDRSERGARDASDGQSHHCPGVA